MRPASIFPKDNKDKTISFSCVASNPKAPYYNSWINFYISFLHFIMFPNSLLVTPEKFWSTVCDPFRSLNVKRVKFFERHVRDVLIVLFQTGRERVQARLDGDISA